MSSPVYPTHYRPWKVGKAYDDGHSVWIPLRERGENPELWSLELNGPPVRGGGCWLNIMQAPEFKERELTDAERLEIVKFLTGGKT